MGQWWIPYNCLIEFFTKCSFPITYQFISQHLLNKFCILISIEENNQNTILIFKRFFFKKTTYFSKQLRGFYKEKIVFWLLLLIM